jgi:3-hydroxyisobutyrate dehydrogenase-like beta-hydroxyacid dehydrogenase
MAGGELGIIGVGAMGGPMWRRLHDQGRSAIVADASPAATAALAAEGAEVAATPAALASRCDTILLSLPTSTQVEEVALGPDGIASGATAGTLVVDLTSGLPSASRRVAEGLADAGVRYVDVGISGGVGGARNGTLKSMAGGSEADVADARPVLELLSARIWHCGPVGAGHLVKTLLNQSNQAKLMVELEALLVAAKAGLDPQLVGEVLETNVWNLWLFGADGRQPAAGFTLALACKDFDVALRSAAEAGAAVPLAAVANQVLRLAHGAAGPTADLIEAVGVWERIAGTSIAPRPDARPATSAGGS